MGLTDREYYREESSVSWSASGRSVVVYLVIANVATLIADLLFGGPSHRVTEWLALSELDLFRPWLWWRLLTFGFVHDPEMVGHIVVNMFVLVMFGREVEALYGPKRFLIFYLTAIVLGGIGWLLRRWVLGIDQASPSGLIGASGAVTAVFLLFVYHFPRRTILLFFVLPVPAWLVGVLYVVTDLAGFQSARSDDWGRVAFDVHLVGAAYGLLYGHFSRAMDSWWGWWSPGRWWRIRRRPRLRVHSADDTEDATMNALAEQADAILDKVNRRGIESLTPAERKLLEQYSRYIRRRLS